MNEPRFALDPKSGFIYKSGSNVIATFKRMGWKPPTEYRKDYEFGKEKK